MVMFPDGFATTISIFFFMKPSYHAANLIANKIRYSMSTYKKSLVIFPLMWYSIIADLVSISSISVPFSKVPTVETGRCTQEVQGTALEMRQPGQPGRGFESHHLRHKEKTCEVALAGLFVYFFIITLIACAGIHLHAGLRISSVCYPRTVLLLFFHLHELPFRTHRHRVPHDFLFQR